MAGEAPLLQHRRSRRRQLRSGSSSGETRAGTGVEADTDASRASAECVVVFDTSSVQAGFDVTYELDGTQKDRPHGS